MLRRSAHLLVMFAPFTVFAASRMQSPTGGQQRANLRELTGWQTVSTETKHSGPEGWKRLFNGKDMIGWEQVGPGKFVLENKMLKTEGGMGLLWYTHQKIGNAVIRVVYQTERRSSNSGVFIRIPEKPTEPWMPVNKGYEVQIDDEPDDYHVTGVLYSLTRAMARPGKPGSLNTMEITLDGPRTVVVVNRVKVTDYTEGQAVPPKEHPWEPDRGPRPDYGYIGLQNHSDKDVVCFLDVSVKSLAH